MQSDSAAAVTRNLLLKLCYAGTNYHGWQIQQNALSVQQVLQDAIFPILGGPHDLKGCSRTDTGVHADEYYVSVRTTSSIPCARLLAAVNARLPRAIAVLECRPVPADFHARYSCIGKEYVYQIWNHPIRNPFLERCALHYPYPLDTELLHRCAQSYIGTHDFSAFCSAGGKKHDPIRTVSHFDVVRDGDLIRMTVAADGFLYHMVRIMGGTLLRIAQRKIAPDGIPAILESRNRDCAGLTAPALGLRLHRVYYDLPPMEKEEAP